MPETAAARFVRWMRGSPPAARCPLCVGIGHLKVTGKQEANTGRLATVLVDCHRCAGSGWV